MYEYSFVETSGTSDPSRQILNSFHEVKDDSSNSPGAKRLFITIAYKQRKPHGMRLRPHSMVGHSILLLFLGLKLRKDG